MDANVNLQSAGMNTGNMYDAGESYIKFVLKQIPDWEENAAKTYGMTDAIQVPVNTEVVVNEKGEEKIVDKSVDLPTLGLPTIAINAVLFIKLLSFAQAGRKFLFGGGTYPHRPLLRPALLSLA